MDKNFKEITVLLLLGSILTLSSFIAIDISNYQMDSQKSLDIFNEYNLGTSNGQSLVYGTFQGDIVHLDPHYAYDSASIDVIDQVVERLYWFDLTDPTCQAVPQLAAAMPTITPDGLEWTIDIQTGIKFHDNTTLDAAAVKWNFDRLMWFFNYSGNAGLPPPFNESLPVALPSGIPTPTQLFGSVYINPDGSPILNRTEVIDSDTVTFHLNSPRGAFFSLLAFTGCGIMSPTSTPANDYIQLHEDLIGTGPFMYDYFTAGVEIKLSAFDDYWQGRAQLDNITIVILPSLAVLNQALLLGDIDILTAMDPAFIDQFAADPDIHLEYGGNNLNTHWVSFKYPGAPGSGQQNLAMRKAISYSLNYTHIIDVVYEDIAVRLPTWIPMGIAYANYTLDKPTFNRSRARLELLNDAYYGPICTGLGLTAASPDSAWTAVADGATPIDHFNYSWNFGSDLRHDTGDRLAYDMRYIGVKMDVNGMAWGDLVTLLVTDRQHLGLFMLGWRPDYIDPENYISPIWSPTADINAGEYYEADVVALMGAGMTETDPVVRKAIYDQIQQLMVERDFPGIPLVTGLNYDAWKNEVKGYLSNPLSNVWWYPVYIDLTPPDITIHSPVSDQVFGVDAPTFTITIIDESPLDSRWYTIDGGVTNYTFSGLIGTVNQTAWDDAEIGSTSLTFYANDTLGNLGSETVNIFKEMVAPDITIHLPQPNQEFGVYAPTFSITIINESLLDSTWYTIDGGVTNYTFSGLTGVINQNAWDSASQGNILITFYAEDDMGKIGTSSVTVIKSIPSEPPIPGYDVFLILGVISLVAIILMKKIKSK